MPTVSDPESACERSAGGLPPEPGQPEEPRDAGSVQNLLKQQQVAVTWSTSYNRGWDQFQSPLHTENRYLKTEMPSVSEVCAFLDELAPSDLAEDWDNVGLLIGRSDVDVRQALTCLTLTPDVAEEAIRLPVQLVVSHHPVLFHGTKRIVENDVEGRMLLDLIEAGVAVYSAHTRYDSARQGINQQLAEAFGLHDISPLRSSEASPALGSGRVGYLQSPVKHSDFLETVRETCRATYLEYTGSDDSPVRHVAVACGSAAEFLDDAILAGCDTFVTGEARFHSALAARQRAVSLILVGHHASERPAMEWLASQLAKQFQGLSAFASRAEHDPLQLYSS